MSRAGCSRTIYLLDDGKDPKKRKWCDKLGDDVVYVSGRKRAPDESNGKSGNLNNALSQIYPAGCKIPINEVVCVMDADQVPHCATPRLNTVSAATRAFICRSSVPVDCKARPGISVVNTGVSSTSVLPRYSICCPVCRFISGAKLFLSTKKYIEHFIASYLNDKVWKWSWGGVQVAMPMFFIKTLPMMDDGDDVAMVLSPQLFNNTDVHADIFNHSNIHFWEYMQIGALTRTHHYRSMICPSLLHPSCSSCIFCSMHSECLSLCSWQTSTAY